MSTNPSEIVPMDPDTLKALKGSIAKWEAIVAGTGGDDGGDNCPLCLVFRRNHDCMGCPVADRTKMEGCLGSPYDAWSAATEEQESPCYATTQSLKELAKAELDFLISLLPKEAM